MVDYNKAREEALARQKELISRQEQIVAEHTRLNEESAANKRELIGLEQILEGLDVVFSEVPPDFETPTLTDHIKKILQQTTVPLLPTQIRDSCLAVGIKGSSMKNLLISVHTVLDRLMPNLEVKKVENKDGYIWRRDTNPLGTLGAIGEPSGPTAPRLRRRLITRGIPSRLPPPPKPDWGVPNPLGRTLADMLKEPQKK